MNDRMTAGDWFFCLFILSCFLFVAGSMVYYQGKAERLENELARLKAECVAKGVAEYGFNEKGNVVFRIKNRSDDCGYCRGRQKGINAEGERK